MTIRYKLITTLLILPFFAVSQNITGVWEGNTSGEYCKIVILQIKDSCFGYTYDTGMGYCKADFIGTYKEATKKLVGKNTGFIERTASHVLSTYSLTYSKTEEIEFLRGFLFPKSALAKVLSFGSGYPVTYRKISESVDTNQLIALKVYKAAAEKQAPTEKPVIVKTIPEKIVSVIDSPVVKRTSPEIILATTKQSRRSTLVKTIEITADTIKLVLYDNGEIDGDTVTVFDNGKMIVERLGLTVKAFEVFIPVNKKDNFHAIELMANNLGSIPPNTAYMLILAGKERYELRLTSDFSVNAQVNIKFKTDKQ
jgi:hypothetical protein